MTKEQIQELVRKKLVGQGMPVDAGCTLPAILNGILDLMAEVGQVGDLAELVTDHKSDLVSAINEVAQLVETPNYVIALAKSADELKAIYEACAANLNLCKNIVFYNTNDELYYVVNGYNMVGDVLKLHAVMSSDDGLVDVVLNLASNGSISIG